MQTVTEILIDFSSSMKDKLALTKTILVNDIIPNLDYSTRIGIKTFSATINKKPLIKTTLPLSIINKEQIVNAINTLSSPDGNTPIAAAIKNSVDSLNEYLAFDKKIILVTDGEENCGGNYTTEVERAKSDGINCQIHIIGIGLTPEAEKQARNIASLSKGSFSPIQFAKGTVYNQTTIKQNLSPFYTAVKQPIIQQVTDQQKPIVSNEINSAPTVSVQPQKEEKETIKVPTEKETLKEDPSIATDDALKLIITEIKDIKNQIKELKKEREEVPDVIEDTELNERIRKTSEEYLYEILKKKYPDRVKWLNESGESYSDHDFEILDLDGSIEYFIECKGTPKTKPTFYLTKEEWRLFLNHTKNYQIYFVKNSFSSPTPIFIDNLLDWLLRGKVVPYLKEKQAIKEERVFLTLNEL